MSTRWSRRPASPAIHSPEPGRGGTESGRHLLIALGVTVIYAVCFVAIKAGLAFAPPLRFAGLRALIAGLVLLGVLAALRRPLLPVHGSWGAILLLALSATTLGFGAMFLSPGRAGAGIASVLGNMQPVVVVVLAALLLGERMTPGKWIALAFGLTGVALIASAALAGPDSAALDGAVLALLASAGAALGSVIVKRMGMPGGVLVVTAWQFIVGSLPLLATSALVERETPITWDGAFIGLLLFLAVVGTALATAVWYWLVQREDVGRLTMTLFLVPAVGLALAAVLFGERIGPRGGLGAVLTLGGILAVAWGYRAGRGEEEAA